MKRTEENLLLDIAKGETSAFSEFYDRHSRLIYGALFRLLKDKDEAQDVLQEVFLQVWRKASTYKPALGVPIKWLVRIAHNRAVNVFRSSRQRMRNAEVDIPEDDSFSVIKNPQFVDDSVLDGAIHKEWKEILALALDYLPHDQAELLRLSFYEGYTHAEISEKLSMPLGTVKTKIRNGLLDLRKSIGSYETEFS